MDKEPEDKTKAVSWFQKAANQGNAEAQWSLGACYINGTGIEEDEEKAFYWYKAAEQGLHMHRITLGFATRMVQV